MFHTVLRFAKTSKPAIKRFQYGLFFLIQFSQDQIIWALLYKYVDTYMKHNWEFLYHERETSIIKYSSGRSQTDKNSLSPEAVSILLRTSIVVGWTARDRHVWFIFCLRPLISLCKACVKQYIKDAEVWLIN